MKPSTPMNDAIKSIKLISRQRGERFHSSVFSSDFLNLFASSSCGAAVSFYFCAHFYQATISSLRAIVLLILQKLEKSILSIVWRRPCSNLASSQCISNTNSRRPIKFKLMLTLTTFLYVTTTKTCSLGRRRMRNTNEKCRPEESARLDFFSSCFHFHLACANSIRPY